MQRVLNAGDLGATSAYRPGFRLDALTCKYMNTTNKVLPTWGIEPQSWQCSTRTRRPQLACVQDIRPHVPELGCTSAVQNEKMYFSFCTAEVQSLTAGTCGLCLERTPENGASPRRHYRVRLDALTCKYMNTTNKSIANLGYRTPSWQCRRVPASPPS